MILLVEGFWSILQDGENLHDSLTDKRYIIDAGMWVMELLDVVDEVRVHAECLLLGFNIEADGLKMFQIDVLAAELLVSELKLITVIDLGDLFFQEQDAAIFNVKEGAILAMVLVIGL